MSLRKHIQCLCIDPWCQPLVNSTRQRYKAGSTSDRVHIMLTLLRHADHLLSFCSSSMMVFNGDSLETCIQNRLDIFKNRKSSRGAHHTRCIAFGFHPTFSRTSMFGIQCEGKGMFWCAIAPVLTHWSFLVLTLGVLFTLKSEIWTLELWQ
ncbi:hypothetical protein OE88DRAFT_758072 [Heliocybe sulcata]|uniref:Uncharacterized protein n=1 Tax=Heliocybe sulcata TaxID=5364 RepID=A0A5C3MSM0_9AGAM|nr:hypothetical protein OE88DRAFT_758072 [Heliocybe sulcata]